MAAGGGAPPPPAIDGEPVTEAPEGTEVSISATADEGYLFLGWTVESGDADILNDAASQTKFTMPAGNVEIRASFVEEDESNINVFDKITDPNFLEYCQINNFDRNGDGFFSVAEARTIARIEADYGFKRGTPIYSLAGIEYFTSLQYLSCFDSAITEVDLSKNPDLTYIHFGTNPLLELDLTNQTKLVELHINSTLIKTIDLSHCPDLEAIFYDACKELTALDFSNNPKITQATGLWLLKLASVRLSNNPALKRLNFTDGLVTELDLSSCTSLEILGCHGNQITSLNVSNNTALRELDCQANRITSLDLSNNTALCHITCNSNRMSELDVTNMTTDPNYGYPDNFSVFCGNQTTDGTTPQTLTLTMRDDQKPSWYFGPYGENTTMNSNVVVPGDGANIFHAIADPVFKSYCERFDTNNDGRLTMEETKAVNSIVVPGMGIASLAGIEYFTDITALVCNNNEITSLDLYNQKLLEDLICNDNKLISLTNVIDVRNAIMCQNNQLTDLRLAGNKNIKALNCSNNKLSNLNLTASPALVTLICHTNELSELVITDCISLSILAAFGNRMAALDASKMADPASYELLCGQQTSDGTTAQTLTLTLREEQKAQWMTNLMRAVMNTGVVLAD